jgi:hypothetical protein
VLRDSGGYQLEADAHGFYGGVYRPTFLPGNTEMRVRLDSAVPLPEGVRVRVIASGKEPDSLPKQVNSVFSCEPTVLPPNSCRPHEGYRLRRFILIASVFQCWLGGLHLRNSRMAIVYVEELPHPWINPIHTISL